MKNPNPAKQYTVRVPVKPYLKKYAQTFHGAQVQLNYNNVLGTLVLCLLTNDAHFINMNSRKKEIRLSSMTAEIECVAPIGTMRYKGFSLTPDKTISISRWLEYSFATDLHRYVQQHIEKRDWRPGIDQAIENFAKLCGIDLDEDISFAALQKCEYRHRKKLEKSLQTFVHSQTGHLQAQVA
jgi:hypothetical protein